MSHIYSINDFAKQYAGEYPTRGSVSARTAYERSIYNFKATGFNLATAATVSTFALGILTSSVLLYVLSFVSYQIRNAFMNASLLIGPDDKGEHIMAYNFGVEEKLSPEIKGFLGIKEEDGDEVWERVYVKFLDFTAWLNLAPETIEKPEPSYTTYTPSTYKSSQWTASASPTNKSSEWTNTDSD